MIETNKIKQIIDSHQTETPNVDYKLIPYLKDKYYELARDVVAMLNCIEAKGQDKFIICGISDSGEIYGIEGFLRDHPNEKIDDANYQSVFDKIQPRPLVTYVQFEYLDHTFGCVYIEDKLNTEKLYEVKDSLLNKKNPIKSTVQGQAFTRLGTSNRIMMQEDREKLISIVRKPVGISRVIPFIQDSNTLESNALIYAMMFSFWDENNSKDIAFVESVTGVSYSEWILVVRQLRKRFPDQITYNGHVWKVSNQNELLEKVAKDIYKEHVINLKRSLIQAISQYDKRYDLEASKRYMSNVLLNESHYSSELLNSVFCFLAYFANNKDQFKNITDNEIHRVSYEIVNTIISSPDWRIIASIKDHLQIIAEIDPMEFLCLVEQGLLQKASGLYQFVNEYENSVISNVNYSMSLFYALQRLASIKIHFSKACYCIFLLSTINRKMIEYLKYILLPWCPMTEADYQQRVASVRQFSSVDDELCWKLVYSLLPDVTRTGGQSNYPIYLACKVEDTKEIPGTFWAESQQYYDFALELARNKAQRLQALFGIAYVFNQQNLSRLLDLVANSHYTNENEKNDLYDALVEKIERIQDGDSSGQEKALIEDIQKTADLISPSDIVLRNKRIFARDQRWRKFEDKQSIKEWQEELFSKRKAAIVECYNAYGIEGISRGLDVFEDSQAVAQCLFSSEYKDELDLSVCSWLSNGCNQKVETVRRYIHLRYSEKTDEWVKSLIGSESFEVKASFLCSLDVTNNTIRLVEELIDEDHESMYWGKVFVINVGEEVYKTVVEHLKKVNRYDDIVELLYNLIQDDILVDPQIVLDTILDFPTTGIERQHTDYTIIQLNKWLERNYENQNKVAEAEIKCIKLFEDSSEEPEALFNALAGNPELFVEILCSMYRPASGNIAEYSNEDKRIAENCFTILHSFKRLPGLQSNGFDADEFLEWFKKVKELAIANDRYDVAMVHIGHILFYTPEDGSGLFINKAIAELLHCEPNDSIREGYEIEAINSMGVHYIDPTGNDEFQLEEMYKKRADDLDRLGLFRFAETNRKIAFSHHQYGIHIRERYEC